MVIVVCGAEPPVQRNELGIQLSIAEPPEIFLHEGQAEGGFLVGGVGCFSVWEVHEQHHHPNCAYRGDRPLWQREPRSGTARTGGAAHPRIGLIERYEVLDIDWSSHHQWAAPAGEGPIGVQPT